MDSDFVTKFDNLISKPRFEKLTTSLPFIQLNRNILDWKRTQCNEGVGVGVIIWPTLYYWHPQFFHLPALLKLLHSIRVLISEFSVFLNAESGIGRASCLPAGQHTLGQKFKSDNRLSYTILNWFPKSSDQNKQFYEKDNYQSYLLMGSNNQVLNFHDFFVNLWFVFLAPKQLIYLMLVSTYKQLVQIWIMLLWLNLIL